MPSLHPDALVLADAHGGIWGNHPDHPVADWQHEVADDSTRLGYWEWVLAQAAAVDIGEKPTSPKDAP